MHWIYWGEVVLWDSLVAQMVKNLPAGKAAARSTAFGSRGRGEKKKKKNLPAMLETQVQSLGKEVPLEGMATHSSTLAWRTAWTEEPGGLQCTGLPRVGHN